MAKRFQWITLIDTNILVYAYDKSEPNKHGIAKKILKESWAKQNAVLSIQNLAEFHSIVTGKIQNTIATDQAKQIVLDLIDGFEILKYNEYTIVNAINNQAIYKIPFWDALIVATMEENSIGAVITENEKDFKKAKWLKTINPFK
jgi:predicted nucleic acid-binding protein